MDGLDQPSTAGAAAALPGCGRTIRQHAPRVEGVRCPSLGAAERGQDAAAELLSVDNITGRDVFCDVMLTLLHSRAGKGSIACSPIRDNMLLNRLSRWRPS